MTNNNVPDLLAGNHFEIHRLENCKVRSAAIRARYKERNVYDIVWVKEDMVHLVAGNECTVHSNTICCFAPGQLEHVIRRESATGFHLVIPADFFCITSAAFNLSFLAGRHSTDAEPVVITISDATQKDVAEIMLKIAEEFNHELSLRLEIIKGLFSIFLLYLTREYAIKSFATRMSRDAVLVDNFFELLRHTLTINKKVHEYAGKLNVTPNYLNQVVKKITGFTASHHIQQQIILEAKKRVLNSGCSMKEVAYGLGFDSMAHFSKFFKTNSGVNFTMFRKEAFCMQLF